MSVHDSDQDWWSQALVATLASLSADPRGLTGTEAGLRLARFGINRFRERPERPLLVQFITRFKNPLVTSLAVVAAAACLPFTPLGTYFGFVPLPATFYYILTGMAVAYLVLVEVVKIAFYRRLGSFRT